MAAAKRITTTVLPGGRVEIQTPDLAVGQSVDIVVIPRSTLEQRKSFYSYLHSLPSRRTPAEWEQFEREFHAERDAWDR
jgi:hypothetical protein